MSESLAARGFQCAGFQLAASLATFIRIAPVHVLILDPHPDDLALELAATYFKRVAAAYPLFHTIGLTRTVPFHGQLIESGLDVVIRKPVSSDDLGNRLESMLRNRTTSVGGTQTRRSDQIKRTRVNNVIQLFR